jgi:4a-hydroxytetrahydrobiopterin dehydratase
MNVCDLTKKNCVPCQGGVPPMNAGEIKQYIDQLAGDWSVVDNHHIEKVYTFPDFATALEFTNRVGQLAETQGHHPDIELGWGRVKIILWTHKIGGLSESDFILAAHIDAESTQE